MINGDKDSSLIKNIQSPSTILTAVLDRTAKKINLQIENYEQYLGDRIRKYKIFNPISKNLKAGENAKNKSFIILGGGQGVHSKRTEVMLFKNKSEGSRNGRSSPLFEQNVSNVRSVVRDIDNCS